MVIGVTSLNLARRLCCSQARDSFQLLASLFRSVQFCVARIISSVSRLSFRPLLSFLYSIAFEL